MRCATPLLIRTPGFALCSPARWLAVSFCVPPASVVPAEALGTRAEGWFPTCRDGLWNVRAATRNAVGRRETEREGVAEREGEGEESESQMLGMGKKEMSGCAVLS